MVENYELLVTFACWRYASCKHFALGHLALVVARGMQVYSVTIAPAASSSPATIQNYIKELNFIQHSIQLILATDKQTDNNCDLVI